MQQRQQQQRQHEPGLEEVGIGGGIFISALYHCYYRWWCGDFLAQACRGPADHRSVQLETERCEFFSRSRPLDGTHAPRSMGAGVQRRRPRGMAASAAAAAGETFIFSRSVV